MSDYEGGEVSRTSSHIIKGKNLKVKPGALPWEEESMTFGRDQGAILLKLQRENVELRKKLKDFNANITEIIDKIKGEKKINKRPEARPEEALEGAKRKLDYYEREYKRLENRISRLSDPGYEASLKSEIQTSKEKAADLENKIRKYEAKQKLRSKELETVMDTGEKVELKREFFEINKEINIYTQKIEKIEDLLRQITKSKEEADAKVVKLEKIVPDKEIEDSFKNETEDCSKKQVFEKTQKKGNAIKGKFESRLKLLEIQIKKLTEELQKSREQEEKAERLLENRNIEYREKQLDLSDLQIKATMNSAKKVVKHNQSYSEDYTFLTEKIR